MLLIVDGSSLLAAFFFATLPKSNFSAGSRQGRAVAMSKVKGSPGGGMLNGVYTFTRSLFSLIARTRPAYLAVAWSDSRVVFRRRFSPSYRPRYCAMPAELKKQVDSTKKLLESCGIYSCERAGYESIDLAGTLARLFGGMGEVCIYTKDERALQLVSPTVNLWLPTKKAAQMHRDHPGAARPVSLPDRVFAFDKEMVRHIYGISPRQLVDVRALCGDRFARIPGVYGIGHKSAFSLVQAFGSIEDIYTLLEPLSCAERLACFKEHGLPAGLLEKLFREPSNSSGIAGKQAAFLSKRLASACCDVSLNIGLNDLKLIIEDRAASALDEFGFKLKLPDLAPDKQQALF